MSRGWSYKPGDWWVSCDVCSKQTRASEIKKRWDGFIVCTSCFEQRHPQDYIKARVDQITVAFSRPQPTSDSFLSSCSTFSAVPGYLIPGCAQPNNPDQPGIIPT